MLQDGEANFAIQESSKGGAVLGWQCKLLSTFWDHLGESSAMIAIQMKE